MAGFLLHLANGQMEDAAMARQQSKCLGDCAKREIRVEDSRLCDYFEPKRKQRYKVCCRNCKHFTAIKLITPNEKDSQV
jgi:hypothetical protein